MRARLGGPRGALAGRFVDDDDSAVVVGGELGLEFRADPGGLEFELVVLVLVADGDGHAVEDGENGGGGDAGEENPDLGGVGGHGERIGARNPRLEVR